MTLLEILKIIAAAATILVGVVGLIWPRRIQDFIGLKAEGGRGITELRTVLGALFIAIGAIPLIINVPETFLMLGYTYLALAAVRLFSMFFDRSIVSSNIISVITEVVFGVILIL
jgi:hypothetical protein